MKIFTPLLQAIIAFCAVFGIWFGIAYYLLDAKIDPVKAEITRVEKTINDKLDLVCHIRIKKPYSQTRPD